MEAQTDQFISGLSRGPAVLFLGQDYLRLETGTDAVLSEVMRKYGSGATAPRSYHELFESTIGKAPESALAWIDERCRRVSTPEWLKRVASYTWNCVYSSAIDSVWPNSFRNSWRDIKPVFEEKYKPSDPRNQMTLHCMFLFGCVNQVEEEKRPPINAFDLRKRRQVAVSLARRLPEVLTPMGILAIDGYAGKADWLPPEDLAPILDMLNPGQAHLFSCSDDLLMDRDMQELIKRKKLTIHKEGLGQVMAQGVELGLLALGQRPGQGAAGRRILISGKALTVPRDLWLQVSRSAIILDDSLLTPLPQLSVDASYREFRNFLSSSDGRPQWEAYARRFAFSREYEKVLRRVVHQKMAERQLQEEPVLLHGQTGSGKTVALASLAYSVCAEGKQPVLFIERMTQHPVQSDIDRFCQWAEDAGTLTTLVIWDGMTDRREYSDLLGYLTSRGRKTVLVGSCYRFDDAPAKALGIIEAPAELTAAEVAGFSKFLAGFDPSLASMVTESQMARDPSFLVALYRLLPPTRGLIRAGVSREVGYAERQIAESAGQIVPKSMPGGVLADAMLKAGIIGSDSLLPEGKTIIDGEELQNVQALTGLVMIPGRFGIRVPLELLVRTLGRNGYANFHELFKSVDIFRWAEDAVGNIEVGPRNRLEADLLVQSRMGGPQTELAFAKRLLIEVREGGNLYAESREINFAVDLVRAMGPSGEHSGWYSPYFRDLADTLRQLREERSVENPRLMLQEANLLREWAIDQSKRNVNDQSVNEALVSAEEVLRRADEKVDQSNKRGVIRNSLLVELAATLAARAKHNIQAPTQAIRFFEDARKALLQVRVQFPEDYHPIDVLYWATRNMLDSGILDSSKRSEAAADLLHTLQSAEPEEFDPEQQVRFHRRRLEFATAYGLDEMADQAFEALAEQGSAAGYYLRALHMSGLAGELKSDEPKNLPALRRAHKYLEENRAIISNDARCLDLLLDLWWLINAKCRFLVGERKALPFDDNQWRYCLEIITAVEKLGTSPRPTLLAFIRGIALFHLRDFEQAFEVFREVERESGHVRGRRRIIRSYVASVPSGMPRKFHGNVTWVSPDATKGQVYVEEIRRRILFFPRDFGRQQDIGPGDTLGEFHIAFNFLGPTADPPSYYKA